MLYSISPRAVSPFPFLSRYPTSPHMIFSTLFVGLLGGEEVQSSVKFVKLPSPHPQPLSQWVYKPGTWLTTFGDMADTSIRTWKSSLEDCHALERGIGHVVASGVCAVGQSVEGEF